MGAGGLGHNGAVGVGQNTLGLVGANINAEELGHTGSPLHQPKRAQHGR